MAKELPPSDASSLARDVYLINETSEKSVSDFLQHRVFSQQSRAKVLKARTGGRVLLRARDAFGICAVGGGAYQGDLFLVFRGSTFRNMGADWLTNGRVGLSFSRTGLPIHLGFNQTFNSMLDQLRSFLSSAPPGTTVHCIGHSLGGAIASLAADWFSKQGGGRAVKLYSFGAPRVGTESFARSTEQSLRPENINRAYHHTDPVPMVPLFPYTHAPLNSFSANIPSTEALISGQAHRIGLYIKRVQGKSWADLKHNVEAPYQLESAIENWLRSRSPVDLNSHVFWRWCEAALIFVVRKISVAALYSLQSLMIGAFTFADKIAYLFLQGANVLSRAAQWVLLFVAKLSRALGMKEPKSEDELDRSIIRSVLISLDNRANSNARQAMRFV
ncbi:lipase family protein [Agaribacterium haliotis]|uniref:lipase family protein n=1 Tax=Agaribacterium haliotis TaxID=2013869 RepID=UPI000BB53D10|nr:lipase family protein [Agaribacterium haliotis]